jgi:hypothetical protein
MGMRGDHAGIDTVSIPYYGRKQRGTVKSPALTMLLCSTAVSPAPASAGLSGCSGVGNGEARPTDSSAESKPTTRTLCT